MPDFSNTQTLSTIAAVSSAIAAILSVFATWYGPRSAAKLAEKLRVNTDYHSERRKQKLFIFATLMQERATIYNDEAVKALNVIDFVFYDSKPVKDAWAELLITFDSAVQHDTTNEKLRNLLSTIANDLGLGYEFGVSDFGRVYYPNALAQENLIRALQRQNALANLRGDQPPSANTAPTSTNLFPPAP